MTFAIGYTISNLFAIAELPVVEVLGQYSILKFEEGKLTEQKTVKLSSDRKNCTPTDSDLKYHLLNDANKIEKDINHLDTEKTVRGKTKVKLAQGKSRNEFLRKQIEELKRELEKTYRNGVLPMNLLHIEKCYELNERKPSAKTNR